MGIKKIFLTGLFFAMALVGYGQNEGYEIDEETGVCTISTAQGLLNFNDRYEYLRKERNINKLVFNEGTYDLTNVNWISNIEIAYSVSGGGATIRFSSTSDDNSHATGLFKSIVGSGEGISIENLKIEAKIEDGKSDSQSDFLYLGALANKIEGGNRGPVTIGKVAVSAIEGNTVGIHIGERQAENYVGGIIGQIDTYTGNVIIEDCTSSIPIVVEKGKLLCNNYVGGIVGDGSNSDVAIDMCANMSEISVSPASSDQITYVGGILGSNISGRDLTISACIHSGKINVTAAIDFAMGGIVGYLQNANQKSTISACANHGELYMGYSQEYTDIQGYVGGLVGEISSSESANTIISNCYIDKPISVADQIISKIKQSIEGGADLQLYSSVYVGKVFCRNADLFISNVFCIFRMLYPINHMLI